ncbi:siderophore-interacting protein [Nocardioides sp. TRM66260-LWL]|uniref:siderophore-interacting protein n=1 Tax=Nocardioides sp. TRM66260-LWL TaxID=2874478 RepID=UPI001CC787DF|nr:siderophore-interacting protein [Nocardioides sp. TRM66260-LWL]MBZ5735741.1 siderophore-interacting protein [Nocardioides sp. TRM66260-LWL]
MTIAPTRPVDAGRPLLLADVEVAAVRRLAPSFVRLELVGPDLDGPHGLGVDGPWLDQRIKLVLPVGDTAPRPVALLPDDWHAAWRALPAAERGAMRTYTVRDVLERDDVRRLVVDVVVHEDAPGTPQGPGCRWALAARPGDRVGLIAPRRGHAFGGIEFLPPRPPGPDAPVLLVGDETAQPAIAGILRDLPADARGHAVVELPTRADVEALAPLTPAPDGVEVVWLARERGERGTALAAAVLALLGLDAPRTTDGLEIDPDLWETAAHSASGEPLVAAPAAGATPTHPALVDRYAWIAGEAGVVTGLRRTLVREHGMPRRDVAFMGYWRQGRSCPLG